MNGIVHHMNLYTAPFNQIKNGTKTIEMRLYDEKRQKMKTGDYIEFTNILTKEVMLTKIISLITCRTFFDLYPHFDKIALGYQENETPHPEDMYKYYTHENISKYGVVAIEIKLINNQ